MPGTALNYAKPSLNLPYLTVTRFGEAMQPLAVEPAPRRRRAYDLRVLRRGLEARLTPRRCLSAMARRTRQRHDKLFRLIFSDRKWEAGSQSHLKDRFLRPVLPVVFYQGRRRWRYAQELAESFPPEFRGEPWVPRFRYLVFDQTRVAPEQVVGALRGRLLQLAMMHALRAGPGGGAGALRQAAGGVEARAGARRSGLRAGVSGVYSEHWAGGYPASAG